jgi:hypothetical protein
MQQYLANVTINSNIGHVYGYQPATKAISDNGEERSDEKREYGS